jgi:DHA1 family tetracycline resistance protein-like MFS transporter
MTAAAPQRRAAAFVFIFITVALDMLAIGIIIPVLPKLIEDFAGGDTARASEYVGLFGTVWALMQFLCSPLQGVLSDRFGRRPIVLLSNLGLGIDYVIMALAPNLIWLFIGRVLSGITSASIAAGYAYVADVTPPEQRSTRFGLLGAAFGFGFVIGPALGGFLAIYDLRLPFWVAGIASFANFLYGAFVLPESLSREKRATFSWARANPVGSLILLRSHPELSGLAAVNLLGYTAHAVLPVVSVLYASYRYGWGLAEIGSVLAFVGVCAVFVQAVLVGHAVRLFGDRAALLIGLICGTLGFLVYGLASTGFWFWCGVPLTALWGLSGPTAQSLMSRHVSASEQGQLQGSNASIQGLGSLIGPGVFSLVFAYAIDTQRTWHLPGLPFLLAGLLLAIAAVAAWAVTRLRPTQG